MQQVPLPQWQPQQADRPAAAGVPCAHTTGVVCAHTSATLNRMANSRFTLVLAAVTGPGSA